LDIENTRQRRRENKKLDHGQIKRKTEKDFARQLRTLIETLLYGGNILWRNILADLNTTKRIV
jgi:hypothetical protein